MGEGNCASEIAALYALSFIDPFGTPVVHLHPAALLCRHAAPEGRSWQLTLGFAALLEILPIHTGG